MRRRTKVLGALGAVLLSLAGAELVLRVVQPRLHVQILSERRELVFHGEGEDFYWTMEGERERRELGCPERVKPVVVLVGSSILYSSGLPDEHSTGPLLRQALSQRGADACVINAGQPAGNFASERAWLAAEEEDPADLLVWELWATSPMRYVRAGGRAWVLGDLKTGPDGLPDPWGLGGLNPLLLEHSRVYELAALRLSPREGYTLDWAAFGAQALTGMQEQARRLGSQLLVVSFPTLEGPFDQQHLDYGPVIEEARRRGIPVLEMNLALGQTRPEDIRLDRCCHYNEQGMKQVAEHIADAAVPLLVSPE